MTDVYVNTEIAAGKKANAAENAGVHTWESAGTLEVLVADNDADIKRFIRSVPWNTTLSELQIYCDAIAGAVDIDIGLYEGNLGDVIDADLLADGLTLAAAKGRTDFLDGLSAVDIADINKPLYLLAGETLSNHKLSYDIAFTYNTIGAAAGTISWLARFRQG